MLHSSSHEGEGADCAVEFIEFLLAPAEGRRGAGWTLSRVADTLAVPPAAVVSALTSGQSSRLLRWHVRDWIRRQRADTRASAVPHWPRRLAAQVVQYVDATEARALRGDAEAAPGDSILSHMDDATRAHFARLRRSVGHSFTSLLNRPPADAQQEAAARAAGAAVSSWAAWAFGSVGGSVVAALAQPAIPAVCVPNELALQRATTEAAETLRRVGEREAEMRRSVEGYLTVAASAMRRRRELLTAGDSANELLGVVDALELQLSDGAPLRPPGVEDRFFAPDFSLSDVVAEVTAPNGGGNSDDAVVALCGSRGAELQRQQAAVETWLLCYLHCESQRFYDASLKFDELADDSARALNAADGAAQDVHRCSRHVAASFVTVAQLHRRRTHLRALMEVLEAMSRYRQHVRHAMRASDMAATASRLSRVAQFADAHPDLARVDALSTTRHTVASRQVALAQNLPERFAAAVAYAEWGSQDWDRVRRLVRAVLQAGSPPAALTSFRDNTCCDLGVRFATIMMREAGGAASQIPLTIISNVLQARPAYQNALRSAIAQISHAAPFEAFLHAASSALDALAEDMHRAHTYTGHLVDAFLAEAEALGGADPKLGQHMHATMQKEMRVALRDLCLVCGTALLDSRAEDAACGLPYLARVGATFETASVTLARACARDDAAEPFTAIRAAASLFIRGCFKQHHQQALEMLMSVVQVETWTPLPTVDAAFQVDLDFLSTVEALPTGADMAGVVAFNCATAASAPTLFDVPPAAAEQRPLLVFTGRQFAPPQSVLLLVQTLAQHVRAAMALPVLAAELPQRAHVLLKMYDGQCTALVLGGGAVEHGTLESLSWSHLAVASRALVLLSLVAQRLRKICAAQPAAARDLLGRAANDLNAHATELLQKVLSLFVERLDALAPPTPEQWTAEGVVSRWTLALLKEVARLRKTVHALLHDTEPHVLAPALRAVAVRLHRSLQAAGLPPSVRVALARECALLFTANAQRFGFGVAPVLRLAREALPVDESPAVLAVDASAAEEDDAAATAFFIAEA